jgi:hypothetical protein
MLTLEDNGSALGRPGVDGQNADDDDRDRQIINQLTGSVPASVPTPLEKKKKRMAADSTQAAPGEKLKVRINGGGSATSKKSRQQTDPEGTSSGRSGSSSQDDDDDDDTLKDEDDDDDDDDEEEAAAVAAAIAAARKKKRQQKRQQQQKLAGEKNVPPFPAAKVASSEPGQGSGGSSPAPAAPEKAPVPSQADVQQPLPEGGQKASTEKGSPPRRAGSAPRLAAGNQAPRPRLAASAAAQLELLRSKLDKERRIVKSLQAVLDQYTK